MDLKEIGFNTRNWVDSAQDMDCWRVLVNAELNLRVPELVELIRKLVNMQEKLEYRKRRALKSDTS